MKRKSYRSSATLLMGGLFLFGLGGCSSTLNFSSWTPFSGQDEGYFASRKTQQDLQTHYRLACAYQEKNQHQMALEEFKRALQLDPNHAPSYNGMGISYDRLGNYSRALGCYTAALRINPDLDYVHNNMGYSYLLQGEAAPAAAAFQKAIALNKTNARYRNNLGVAYAQMGKVHQALAEFKTTEIEAPPSAPPTSEKMEPQQVAGRQAEGKNPVAASAVVEAPTTDLTPAEPAAVIPATASPVAAEPPLRIAEKNTSDPFQPDVKTVMLPQDKKTTPAVPVPDRIENRIVPVLAGETKDQAVAKPQPEPVQEKTLVVTTPPESAEARTVAKAEPEPSHAMNAMPAHTVSAFSVQPVSAVVPGNKKMVSAPQAQQMFPAHTPLGQATVEVVNGTGGKGVAAWWGDHLWQQGVTVTSFSNAPVYAKTRIYYTEGYLQEAYQVAKIIPQYQEFERVATFENKDIKIRVVIGRDVLRFTGKAMEKKVLMARVEI